MSSYSLKQTLDGSLTLHSPRYGEDCHSSYGAKTETEIYYLNGCQILQKLERQQKINILEVGFGIGLGLKTTFEKTQSLKLPVNFISLEIDETLINFVLENNILNDFKIIKKPGLIEIVKEHFSASILLGDARQTLPHFTQYKFDAIYQDAFSPKRNSILWTVEWFRLLKEKSAPEVIMSTYSASSSVRKSMIEARWKVSNGPQFSGKRSSTVAKLSGESEQEILNHLERSPVPIIWDESHEEFAKLR